MPLHSIDYSNVCFYKIVCKDINITDLYIGHTTDFTRRRWQHKSTCLNPDNSQHNSRIYSFIRENGGWDNWDMILIDRCSCRDSLEAKQKERNLIEILSANLNTNIPSRSKKESFINWYSINKEHHYAKSKEYKEQHKEQIVEQQREYRIKNKEQLKMRQNTKCVCECGGRFTISNKAKHYKSEMHQAFEEAGKKLVNLGIN